MKKTLFSLLLICSAIVAIYAQTLKFDFVSLDEEDHIANRYQYLSSWRSIPESFLHNTYHPNGTSEFYRPLHALSFKLDVIRGIHPGWSHGINLMFHVGATLLLFWLLLELGISKTKALILTLLFAVHPIASRIVAWVPGRNDATLALFALASCIAYIRWLARPRMWILAVHLMFFFGAFLSKELGIVLPFLYILIPKKEKLSRNTFAVLYIGWTVVAIAWWLLRSHALLGVPHTPWKELFSGLYGNIQAIPFYLQTALFPIRPLVTPTMREALQWFPLLVSVLFAGCALWLARRTQVLKRQFAFGIAWFFLFLLPALASYGSETRAIFFEHRGYLPLMGLLFAAAAVSWRDIIPLSRLQRFLLAGVFLVYLALQSFFGARDFKNPLTFWTKAVTQAPQYAGSHKGLGSVYVNQNNFDDAKRELEKALELNPKEKRVHNNLGVLYLRQKRVEEAEMQFLAELGINPTYAITHQNLGFVYATQRRFADAEKSWLTALTYDPWYAAPHEGLAIVYAIAGQKEQSLRHIEALISLGAPISQDVQKIYDEYSK